MEKRLETSAAFSKMIIDNIINLCELAVSIHTPETTTTTVSPRSGWKLTNQAQSLIVLPDEEDGPRLLNNKRIVYTNYCRFPEMSQGR
jgi:hypothetical protein